MARSVKLEKFHSLINRWRNRFENNYGRQLCVFIELINLIVIFPTNFLDL